LFRLAGGQTFVTNLQQFFCTFMPIVSVEGFVYFPPQTRRSEEGSKVCGPAGAGRVTGKNGRILF
jgi:hypothetical protein